MRVRSLQHVSSPFPDGGEAALRAFYGDVLGLREPPTPSILGHMELVWFAAGDGLEPYDDTPIPNRPRFFCRDPAGNLVEFTHIEGPYWGDKV